MIFEHFQSWFCVREERKELQNAAATIFYEDIPDKNVQTKYMMELVKQFDVSGSVQNK